VRSGMALGLLSRAVPQIYRRPPRDRTVTGVGIVKNATSREQRSGEEGVPGKMGGGGGGRVIQEIGLPDGKAACGRGDTRKIGRERA